MYMKHQRTLHQKRVSKGNANAKAKSSPVVDDAASNVSLESLVSVPVVILPLDSQSVNIDDNLSNLGNIQNIDNVVEIQSQPEVPPTPPPPPTSAVFDAGTIASVFERIHDLLDKFKGRSTPPPENVGSVRRSPTAGTSDIARPNPLAQVTDSAPQGPDAAPGPSRATHVPPAPGPSHHAAHSSGDFPSARVEEDDWEPIRTGSRRDSSPEGLRDSLEFIHTKITQHREIIDFIRACGMSPVNHYYRDLDLLHAEYDRLSQTLIESREAAASRRCRGSPDVAPPGVASPAAAPRSPRQGSSSRTGLRHSPQPGPSSSRDQRFASQDLPRSRDVSSDRSRHRGISQDRSRKRFVASDRWRFASGDSPSPKRRRFTSDDSTSPQHRHSSRASSGDGSFERPPSRSSPALPSSPSREDRDPDDSFISAPVQAMIDFILKSFPESQASPSQPSSRSFDLSASAGVTDLAIPPGSLLAWSHALSDSFSETQQRFACRIKDGKACHTLLPTLSRFERVSNSPTQGKELRANPDVLDLLRNRVPDSRYVLLSLKEVAALERTLRSVLESHNFLTWSVVGFIRSLHEKKLLPKDDQIISQLQKSFSKACGNVASGISSSAAFVTLKRRQLLLSHVVPSVSDAQKRNLLSDPFFQTGSLFSSSSVEAARDLSLFKPHLKASSSTTQARRSGYSSSAVQRGPAMSSSAQSSAQRSSSPLRPQSGKKGDSHFQKKSSGPHQKRGGFSEVGALSLIGGRRLPSQLLVGLEGSGGGRLGSGGSAGRLSDPFRPSTSSFRAPTLPAGVLPTVHQGSRLNPGASKPSSEGGSRTSPSVSGFLQPSIPRPEGFGVVAPHHRPVDPERLRYLVSLSYGDSTISPSFHPSGRLDGFPGPAGRLPAGSCSSRFASLSSLCGRGKDVPVQGPLFRSDDRAPSLHEDYGSSFHHPSQVWGQDASLPGRLAHPGLFGARLFTVEGQAPDSMHRTWHPGQPHEIVSSSHSITSVSRHGDSVSAFHCSTYSSTGQQSPSSDRGVPVDPVSSSVPLASTSGPLVVPGGMLRMRLLQLCLKDQWDFLDDQFQVSWSPLCREDLLWWARVAQWREGVSLSPFQTSAFSQTPRTSVGGP